MLLILFVLGLVIGSFVSAFSYRAPLGISVSKGRSFCPKCKKQLYWYENIPVLSFLALRGKCSGCDERISRRYPLIELITGLSFVDLGYVLATCSNPLVGTACGWQEALGGFTLFFLLVVITVLITIFVIDLEHQIIPDELVFFLFGLVFFALLLTGQSIYLPLFAGFISATFLLILHLFTYGKGMGLGDVKFALSAGILVSWPFAATWMFLSFLIGAVVGVIMLLFGKTKFGKHIPFGPFLVISLILILFGGEWFLRFFPYL